MGRMLPMPMPSVPTGLAPRPPMPPPPNPKPALRMGPGDDKSVAGTCPVFTRCVGAYAMAAKGLRGVLQSSHVARRAKLTCWQA